ncbi:Progesterone-induced-blocking factor 1 [Phytophthora citrophthora]|uniref:Progesterone-induced-blocking factor 1 n=1 Tax=Phytophthora citrophthora TaxID=4793 RepID=A0AAD9G191_9STRA|nr:Progesterone-induced-blocking factor 1 [Phytophthora citrophthora]
MAARATSAEDRRFRRLAAQLGVSRHVLGSEDTAEPSGASSAAEIGVETTAQAPDPTNFEVAEEEELELDEEIELEAPNDEEEEEDDVGELSLTLPSDSASEGLSSDLSLPHSFGHYDRLSTGRGISHFDDHLAMLSPGQMPSGRANRLQLTPQRATSTDGSEAVMKKFYEIQVGKIRAQLALSVQAQRELEETLQQERAVWQQKEAEMKHSSEDKQSRLEKELKRTQVDLQAALSRLRMEKTHFASLEISDALAEQLQRQDEEDLSIREFIQLSIHSKVRKMETELERCRQEVEMVQRSSSADKAAAAGASDEIQQVQRIAEAKGRRLQHELELSEATRMEMEQQIKTLVEQVEGMKEEQRRSEDLYSDQRSLQKESERLKRDLQILQQEHEDLQSRFNETSTSSSELHGRIALLSADKSFLQDAKMQLEDQLEKLRQSLQNTQDKVNSLQEKHDGNLSQSAQLQNETRLHFEKKLDDEMSRFMDLSKREIDRIRNDGQVVYERENRLLKEARDDALKHVEVLQARLDSIQSALDEKASSTCSLHMHCDVLFNFVLESTRMESTHTTELASARTELKMRHFEISQLKLTLEEKATSTRNARLEIDMLTQKVEAHKEEFARLETTSTTRITQLEAALDVERNKLKEYELLEVDLDGAILQTGEVAAEGERDGSPTNSKLQEVVTTFGAIPTTTKRRFQFQQSVLLAQKVVKAQREAIALEQKLNEVTSDRVKLQQQVVELKAKVASFHQPQSYLIDKLSRREQQLQAAVQRHEEVQSHLQQLRAQYQQLQDANSSLRHQLQQLLSRRGDLDALKATVQLLQGKIQASTHQQKLYNEFTKPPTAVERTTVDPVSFSPKVSPPPSITRPPTPQKNPNFASEVSSSSSISSTPKCINMAAHLSLPLLRRAVTSTAVHGASTSRRFATASGGSDEALKADFKRWLKKETALLTFMVVAGATGVHFYQNREDAPVKQVERLIKQAEQNAKEGEPKQALQHCLHAYDVVKRTNPHDRHLFELAFSIASQYEALARGAPTTTYYLDALEHNSREMKVAKRERNRVVTLDRIAQSYENRGHIKTAERYFKQAISAYDQNRGRRELSKASTSDQADLAGLDREIPGVLFNYAQMLMANERWTEAGNALQRAMTLARVSSLSDEYVELIEDAMASVRTAKAKEKAEAEQQQELK